MPDTFSPSSPGSSSAVFEKKQFISDLALGADVAELFIIASAQQGQARNGPYWRIDFRDASGSIGGKLWSPQSLAYPDLASGQIVEVKGRVTSYRDKLELGIDALRVLDAEEGARLDPALFMPASPHNPDAMLEELKALGKATLTHQPWRKLFNLILNDEDIAAALRMAPAAKVMHHAYAGGLLEHTLSVVRLCLRIADNYEHLDRQALFMGALCHDLGKLWELTSGLAIDYTSSGRLIGHISLVMERLLPLIKKSGLEPPFAEHLQHLVLSHHGTYEFGSPRLPSTAEAVVLHYADNIDAKLQQVANALQGVEPNGWSAYIPGLERAVFRAEPTPQPAKPARQARAAGPRTEAADSQPLPLFDQCSLLLKG